ncbi:uncharacterized protein [Rutidosis leptorrhynchoides]|uniref:uncharacterized protein n=1 Tax=Rutidosis leptorrhynchoides TaxID=125765 RepID=UPI003A9A5A4F
MSSDCLTLIHLHSQKGNLARVDQCQAVRRHCVECWDMSLKIVHLGIVCVRTVIKRNRKNPPPPEAIAFQMSVDATTATDDAIIAMFLVNSVSARVLFDCGANRSFVSTTFCTKLNVPVIVTNEPLSVEVGDGRNVRVTKFVSRITIDIKGSLFPVTFLVMPIPSFDVVLDMNWLSDHKVVARGDRGGFRCPLLSMMKAQKSLAKGCDSFFAYVIDVKKEKKVVSNIPVVSEYPEVFPDEFPGLPPIREVEYKI